MKVALLNPMPERRGVVNKDISGGFGTVSDFGDGRVARALTWLKRRGVRYPVLSLAYIAAIFERAGWQVAYSENGTPPGADLALVYTSLVAHRSEIDTALRLRSAGVPKVGFVGPFAAVSPSLFAPYADFVVVGEPETTVARLARGEALSGNVRSSPVEDLDTLPFPAWRHFDIESFRYQPYFPAGDGFFPVLSSRGCTLSCAYYCPYTAVTGRVWRRRTPENVVEELAYLAREYGARRILFRDPLFTLDRERAIRLAQQMRDAKLSIEWVCETHLDYLNEELLDELHAAGLRSLKVGIESANAASLAGVKRHQPREDRIRRILAHCDRLGIGVVAFYILGLPADTEESVEATIDYAIDLNTLGAQFTVATPYPGTGFFDDAHREGRLLTDDWERYDIYTPVIRHDHLSPSDISRLKSLAYQRYYLRPSWAGKFVSHWWRRIRSKAPEATNALN